MALQLAVKIDVAESIRRGRPSERDATLVLDEKELGALSKEDRALIAARVNGGRVLSGGYPLELPEPTLDGLVEAVRADEERRLAKEREREQREAELQAAAERVYASLDLDALCRMAAEAPAYSPAWCIEQATGCDPETAYRASLLLREEQRQAIKEAQDAAIQRQRAELDAEMAARAAEEAAWIREHGSPRLRRILEEDIEYHAVYRDERLALERPGWVWECQTSGTLYEPRNPPEEAFALLDEAREREPGARLMYFRSECECDDDECECEDWRGYVAVAEFLDRTIVYGAPNAER